MKKMFATICLGGISSLLLITPASSVADEDILDLKCSALQSMITKKSEQSSKTVMRTMTWLLGYQGAKIGMTQIGSKEYEDIGIKVIEFCDNNPNGKLRDFIKFFDEKKTVDK